MKARYFLFLLLTFIAGIIIHLPIVDYQMMLSQGDHGRDLYSFQAVLRGELPYRDFWWVYGPLMPYYYALFLKIFGMSINSVLLGQIALHVITGIVFFSVLAIFIPSFFAFIGAVWFLVFRQSFFFTYNHAAGVMMLLAVTFFLFSYIRQCRTRYLFGGLASILILSLIKINFGLAAYLIFILSVFFYDHFHKRDNAPKKKIFYTAALIGYPLAIGGIYLFFFNGLALYELRQCFPYLQSDHPYQASVWTMMGAWWSAIAVNINIQWTNRIFAFLLMCCIAKTLWVLKDNKMTAQTRIQFCSAAGILGLFYILNMHEFLASGVLYRTVWSQPFSILLIFMFVGFAARHFSKIIQKILGSAFLVIIVLRFVSMSYLINQWKTPQQFLGLPSARIHTSNSLPWKTTVTQTTQYLKEILDKNESFLALPYDPLYYFLTQRPSPTRQLIFFDHINIPSEQEKDIIQHLQERNIRYVLISSRTFSQERGMGTFGETNCPLLGRYIRENFSEIARFGSWEGPALWIENHGTKILKRIESRPY